MISGMAISARNPVSGLVLALALGILVVPPARAAGTEGAQRYKVTVSEFREAAKPGGDRTFVLKVGGEGGGAPRRLLFTGPYKLLRPEDPPATRLVGDRLLAFTPGVFAVFDLETGREALWRRAIPSVTPTPDGRRVAFIESQLPFTPTPATSMIINVLDIATLESQPVFPERSAISPGPSGSLMVWEEDPAKRCTTGSLFWSPAGDRLLFFCACDTGEYSSVLVDLRKGLAASRFTRRPLARELYLKPGAPRSSEAFLAVASVTWLDGNRVEVRTAPENRWLKDHVILPMGN